MFEELKYFNQLLSAGSTGPFGLANPSLGVKEKKNNLEAMKAPRPEKQQISSIISLFGCRNSPIRLREEFSAFSKAT